MKNLIIALAAALIMSGCATSLQPFQTEKVTPGLRSKVQPELKELPAPKDKIVAAVYRFRDQTGQYKPSEQVASWSTAVTQGATSILIRSLENSGWFMPIEREGLSNLLNERKIIQSTRQAHGDQEQLSPLLFAGILLEGGVIGYDTNIITGGAGLRYLSTGGSGQYRKDQVTIYLRAVSTSSGRILKTVHTTKSIISQQLESGAFRFVDTDRLLETEAGFTFNEPPVMAVTEAIDEAVKELIIEGVDGGLWAPKSLTAFNEYKEQQRYASINEEIDQTNYFGLKENKQYRTGLALSTGFTFGSYIGSYKGAEFWPGAGAKAEIFMNHGLSLAVGYQRSKVGADEIFSEPYNNLEMMANLYLTPMFDLSPYVGAGGNLLIYDDKPEFARDQYFPGVSAGAGLDYRLSNLIGLKLGVRYSYLVIDGVDGIRKGSIHDQLWNMEAGITIRPGF